MANKKVLAALGIIGGIAATAASVIFLNKKKDDVVDAEANDEGECADESDDVVESDE